MRINNIGKYQIKRKGVAKMLCGSGSFTKKISRKTLIKHPPGDRFDNLVRGEFFNGAFKKPFFFLMSGRPENSYSRCSQVELPGEGVLSGLPGKQIAKRGKEEGHDEFITNMLE